MIHKTFLNKRKLYKIEVNYIKTINQKLHLTSQIKLLFLYLLQI